MSQFKIPLILFFVIFFVFGMLSFFGGSSWGWAIFKAFVSAVSLVLFIVGAKFFLAKYLPDMFEEAERMDVQSAPVAGVNLDVRIGDDVPLKEPPTFGQDSDSFDGLSESASNVSPSLDKDEKATSDEGDSLPSSSPKTIENELASVTQDESSPAFKPTQQYPKASASDSDKKDEVATQGDLIGSNDDKLTEEELTKGLEKDVDRLEELPDLQEFVDSSSVATKQSKSDELMSSGTQSFFETDLSENVTDTNLMANAIRTVLKREV